MAHPQNRAPAKPNKVEAAKPNKAEAKPNKAEAKPNKAEAKPNKRATALEMERGARPGKAGGMAQRARRTGAGALQSSRSDDGPPSSERRGGDFDDDDLGSRALDYGSDADETTEREAPSSRIAKVELAPRSSGAAVPSIPLPVKELPRLPSLEERAVSIDKRLSQQPLDFRARYAESFEMSWIFHDTGLEGIVYTYEELAAAFRGQAPDPALVDENATPIFDSINRHKQAIALVREMVDKKRIPISIDLIKKLYVTLHPDEGDIKTVKYRRDVPQHRLYFHEYAAPDKIAYKLRNVVDWVNSADTKRNVSSLKMAAKAHYDLVRIYPFPKDSGKVARLLMNLLLMRAGFPPAIIHHSERQRYYDALKSSSPSGIVQMLRDSVENSLGSIEKLLDEHDSKTKAL